MILDNRTQTILVTGATGFIGSRVVEHLVDRGYNNVVATGRQPKEWTPDVVLERLVRCDLIQDDLSVLEPADVVVHLAAQQPSPKAHWADYYLANVETVDRLLPLAKRVFIYTSTSSVDGPEGPDYPVTHYGLSKLMGERLIKINTENRQGLSAIIFRLPSVIGVNHHGGILHEIRLSAMRGEKVELFSKGYRYRNLLHVDSLAEAIELALCLRSVLNKFERFELGSSNSVRLIDIANLLIRLIGSPSKVVPIDKVSPNDIDIFMETAKAISKLGFSPLSVQESVRRYLGQLGYEV